MKNNTAAKKLLQVIFFSLLALSFTISSYAAEVWLRAEAFPKTMPDGRVITMWGYAECVGGFATCGLPSVPGPTITVPAGDTILTIHLENRLPKPTSIIIPGQELPTDGVNPVTPVWIDAAGVVTATGARPPLDVTSRVRSMIHEVLEWTGTDPLITPPPTGDYVWNNIRPGTYLYESGTHQAVQVQMGLYGALKQDSGAGEAYPDNPNTAANDPVAFTNEVVLLFSEIDPLLHDAIAGAPVDNPLTPINETIPTYGTVNGPTSTINYLAKYFLINGVPYSAGRAPILLGAAGQPSLLRFLNAGLKTHTPVIHGSYASVVAEDGNLYPFPKQQYSLSLHPGQTVDAVFIPPVSSDFIPVYDRSLGLSNSGATPGGMLVYLQLTIPRILTVQKAGGGTGTVQTVDAGLNPVPGIDCGGDCTEAYAGGTSVILNAVADPGFVFIGWSGGGCTGTGQCTVTMNADITVTATFDVPSAITVTSPNGGENWARGSMHPITWSYTGSPGANVSIVLFKGAAQYLTIAASVPIGAGGVGSYNWTIPTGSARLPFPLGTDYKVRVQSTTNAAYTDMSDFNFTISLAGGSTTCVYSLTPTSSATHLITGETGSFTVTTGASCSWTAVPGAGWITVDSPVGPFIGSGTVNYTVADNTGGNQRTGTITVNGQTFTVNQDGAVVPTGITVSSPNGGESWTRGTMHPVTWSYTGTPGANVSIVLFKGVSQVATIAASVPIGAGGVGSYNWTIPTLSGRTAFPTGADFKVRVQSTTNAAYTDMSDNNFTIQ